MSPHIASLPCSMGVGPVREGTEILLGVTSGFGTVAFQVTVSSTRVKVTVVLQAADKLAAIILMICL